MQPRSKLLKTIGWISSMCFMFSGAPAAYEAYQIKGPTVTLLTLFLWTLGEICAIVYVYPTRDKPLLFNYSVNLLFLSIIWIYSI